MHTIHGSVFCAVIIISVNISVGCVAQSNYGIIIAYITFKLVICTNLTFVVIDSFVVLLF